MNRIAVTQGSAQPDGRPLAAVHRTSSPDDNNAILDKDGNEVRRYMDGLHSLIALHNLKYGNTRKTRTGSVISSAKMAAGRSGLHSELFGRIGDIRAFAAQYDEGRLDGTRAPPINLRVDQRQRAWPLDQHRFLDRTVTRIHTHGRRPFHPQGLTSGRRLAFGAYE